MDLSAPNLWVVAFGATVAWWASTGFILALVGQAERTYRWSLLGAVVSTAVAISVVMATRSAATAEGALAAFTAAIVVWGAIELAFLTGYVVGPVREPCPSGLDTWARFRASFRVISHHEYLLLAALLLLYGLVRDSANTLAFDTFALMWVMRLSTKLNIFLGVSNVSEEFLPARIAYLKTYFRKAPMNALFPLSATVATVVVVIFVLQATGSGATPFTATSATLLATFAALAVIEHWMLVVPFPAEALWPWASGSKGRPAHRNAAPPDPPQQRATVNRA